MVAVPKLRIHACNDKPTRPDGQYVLYWMIANRRVGWNFSLQRAVEHAKSWQKPLVILEALRCDYRWASDRLHRFVLQGMAVNRQRTADSPAFYYPYVEPERGADHGLLKQLAEKACVVVTDDFPTFFLPRMVKIVAGRLPVLLEKVDSNGLLPMRATDRVFPTAYSFRRYLHQELPQHLGDAPLADPLASAKLPPIGDLLQDILKRWPPADKPTLHASAETLARLPIDHSVKPGIAQGGSEEAEEILARFLDERLEVYGKDRNHPDEEAGSGLSPYLHFGHVSAHQIFDALGRQEKWSPDKLGKKPTGKREGWWGMSGNAESFLDEMITWRELGYNFTWQRSDYDQYSSLPDWARLTLEEHEDDPRPHLYSLAEFENAATHDELWNAAQRQLVSEGRMHNYLRMLWGKKILHWSKTPQDALLVMIELNNKYGQDGRNPNSYSGIFWVLGRYDRAWGPERKIFGKVRYMTSDSTMKKLRLSHYLSKYQPQTD